jgi:hypothetical protein
MITKENVRLQKGDCFIAGQAQAYGKDEISEMTLNLLCKSQNIFAHGTN